MSPLAFALISTAATGVVSFIGILLFLLREQTLQRALFLILSFSVGAFLGDVFLHMLPKMTENGATSAIWLTVIGGILASFVLEKFIHWRHCHDTACADHAHPVGILNLLGDFLHNALDGILISGSYLTSIPLGLTTTIAVLLHEIPQEIGDFGVLIYSGFRRRTALLLNVLTALSALLGAFLVFLLQPAIPFLEMYLVPFAAGNFLYIAGSDLIPELHRKNGTGQSLLQFAGILLGIAFMAALMALD